MRDLLAKVLTGSMIAGAALMVSACGGSESTNTTETTNVTEMNTMDANMATDNMTAVDAAHGTGTMAGDMNAMNGTDANMAGGNMANDMNATNTTNGM